MTIIKRQGTRGPQDLLLKKKISSRSPSERYCQSIICSEHTFEQGLKPLEFMITSMGLPWTRIELKLRFFKILVLGLAQLFFGLWLLSLQYDWINILLNIPYIWFLSDRIFCVLISPAPFGGLKFRKPSARTKKCDCSFFKTSSCSEPKI